MNLYLTGIFLVALISVSAAYPLNNEENVALDVGHEAHLGAVAGVEKPPESDIVPLENLKPTEGAIESEVVDKISESEVDLKTEQTAVSEAVVPSPTVAEPVVSEPVIAIVSEPDNAVVAVVEQPIHSNPSERTARAYGYPYNNYGGYGAWSKDPRYNKYKSGVYGSYQPSNYRFGGYYEPGYYWG